jgi:hypothetical protein
MKLLWVLPILLVGLQPFARADTIVPGTQISIQPDSPIDVRQADRGRIYTGHVARDVYARNGDLAIPRGAEAELIVRQTGPRDLALDLESITVGNRRYVVDNTGPQFHMAPREYNQGSGLVGTVVTITNAPGAEVSANGREVRVPESAVVQFDLQQPLSVAGWADPGYTDHGEHYHHDGDRYR